MKFLLMILELNSATADYASVWCKIHKDDRWVTSKPIHHYNEEPMRRTLKEIKTLCSSENNFGCIHKPLLNIPLTHVIPDELHLLLRITDKLLVVVGASEHQFGDMMKFIFQIDLSAIAAHISSLLSPVSLFRTSFSVVFGRPLLRGSSGDQKISEPAGSL